MNVIINKNMMSRIALVIILTFPMFLSFALASPSSATAVKDHPQLQQILMDQYQDRDRERIIGKFEDCLNVGIPSEILSPMIKRGVQLNINAGHMEMMLQEMINSANSDLSPGPVVSKAMEGMAKHVEARHIVAAMTAVRERMEFASKEMKRLESLNFSEQERNWVIHNTAEAMATGMDKAHVQKIYVGLEKRMASGHPRSVMKEQALATMESMKRIRGYGVPSERVAAVCDQMINKNYSGKEIDHVVGEFSVARYKNWNMETTSRSIEGYISDGGKGSNMGHRNWNSGSNSRDHGDGSMNSGYGGDGMGGGGMDDGHGGMNSDGDMGGGGHR